MVQRTALKWSTPLLLVAIVAIYVTHINYTLESDPKSSPSLRQELSRPSNVGLDSDALETPIRRRAHLIDIEKHLSAIDVKKRAAYHTWASSWAKANNREMGHTADDAGQTVALGHIVRQYKPDAITVCELGFNLGHSAATILSALDTPKKFIAFDFGEGVVQKAIEELQRTFVNVDIQLIKGNTADTVPAFVRNNTGFLCDMVHIDAGHTEADATLDLQNVRPMARDDTIVLMDDCGCISFKAWWCDGVNKAVAKGAADGFIHILSMGEYNFHFKGTCVVQYHHYGAPVPWVARLPPPQAT